jgi:hypothetical protein
LKKATFQKPDATYPHGSLREQPKEWMPVHSSDSKILDRVPMEILSEKQAQSNHGQTLKRLKERGGLGLDEILAIIENRRWPLTGTETSICLAGINKKIQEVFRTIPCSENNWKDGQEYEQAVDYIKEKIPVKPPNYFISGTKELLKAEVDENGHYFFWQARPVAVPIVAQETEDRDDLWLAVGRILDRNSLTPEELMELNSQFTIQRRKQ